MRGSCAMVRGGWGLELSPAGGWLLQQKLIADLAAIRLHLSAPAGSSYSEGETQAARRAEGSPRARGSSTGADQVVGRSLQGGVR